MSGRYDPAGAEAEFEPGSRGRVLRNKLGIRSVGDMQLAESKALDAVHEWAAGHFDSTHRFTAQNICELHRRWLGDVYEWAGQYRSVNIAKGDFMFAAASQVPRLMAEFERNVLAGETPCADMAQDRLATALARTHAELVLIHPFREGNGRCSRLLAVLMALQGGMPTLDFWSFSGRGKRGYVAAIHAAVNRDYEPLRSHFSRAIKRTYDAFGDEP